MKKITALIFALCMALTLTIPAFADVGGPAFSSYEVTLTADTQYFRTEWNDDSMHLQGTLPAGTVVTVHYEYEQDGINYASVSLQSDTDRWYFIRLSDIHLNNAVYGPENGRYLSEPTYVLVIAKDGVALHAGPNEKYDVLTTIPQNIRLGYVVDNSNAGEATWAYVTYHDYNGWIYIGTYEGETGLAKCREDKSPIRLWAMIDTPLYGGTSEANLLNELSAEQIDEMEADIQQPADPIVGTFARGVKCDCLYYKTDAFGRWFFVSVGDQSGWAFANYQAGNIARQDDQLGVRQYISMKPFSVDLYAEPDASAQSTAVSVGANTEFEEEYMVTRDSTEYVYVTLAGKHGWARVGELSVSIARQLDQDDPWTKYDETRYVGATDGTPIYGDLTDSSTQIGTIPANTQASFLYSGYLNSDYAGRGSAYRVRYGNVTGWVWEEDMQVLEDVEYVDEPQAPDSPDGYDGTWRYEEWNNESKAAKSDPKYAADIQPDAEKAEKESGIGMSPMLLVLICVAAAALLTIIVCVTLMLIRRKRKK